MAKDDIHIPFNRKLYNDIVRCSNGRLDPAELAEDQVRDLIERNLDSLAHEWFGDQLVDLVRAHFPHYLTQLEAELCAGDPSKKTNIPLIWKELTVPSGTEVRMQYAGSHHFARVKDGKIEDADGRFSPSEWASKIANGTSRNAWRDLWFKKPTESAWVPAELLRSQSRGRLSNLGSSLEP
ncbi:hypothetical protein [Rhodosalinus sp. FB01]|uniref:hypothetical protein n=1 Tax=Rhodosalinus sp. FB01 TaxID=3239194 RepID=UPI003524376E